MAITKKTKLEILDKYVYFIYLNFSPKQAKEYSLKNFEFAKNDLKQQAEKTLNILIEKNKEEIEKALKKSIYLKPNFKV